MHYKLYIASSNLTTTEDFETLLSEYNYSLNEQIPDHHKIHLNSAKIKDFRENIVNNLKYKLFDEGPDERLQLSLNYWENSSDAEISLAIKRTAGFAAFDFASLVKLDNILPFNKEVSDLYMTQLVEINIEKCDSPTAILVDEWWYDDGLYLGYEGENWEIFWKQKFFELPPNSHICVVDCHC